MNNYEVGSCKNRSNSCDLSLSIARALISHAVERNVLQMQIEASKFDPNVSFEEVQKLQQDLESTERFVNAQCKFWWELTETKCELFRRIKNDEPLPNLREDERERVTAIVAELDSIPNSYTDQDTI